jgi:hypothetical protein
LDGGWGWRREYSTTISCAQLDAYNSGPMMMIACCLELGAWSLELVALAKLFTTRIRIRRPATNSLTLDKQELFYIEVFHSNPLDPRSPCRATLVRYDTRLQVSRETRAQVWAFIRCDQFTYRKFLRHFYSSATHTGPKGLRQSIPPYS